MAKTNKNKRLTRKQMRSAAYRPFKHRSEVGDLPGNIASVGEACPTVVNYFAFDKLGFEERKGLDLKSLRPMLGEAGPDQLGRVVWLDVAETFRDVASDLRDLYFTKLSQRTNEVMKLLTVISTIFMPLSFIAGVYGMNFNSDASPYNMPETQWRIGYPVVIAFMAVIAAMMLGYFYRKGWIFSR